MTTPASEGATAKHWVDGNWRDSTEHHDSINPATGEVIGSYAYASREDTGEAVEVALRVFRETPWKNDPHLRSRVLNEMAEKFDARTQDLVQLLSTENGKIVPEAIYEVQTAAPMLRYYAALVLTDQGRAAEWEPGSLSVVLRQPIGVAGISVPWNSPVALLIRSLAPALGAGCTTVVKMPKETAQMNALISQVIAEVKSLPRGVVNMITGGHEALAFLCESPDVQTISFTGSSKTGSALAAMGAPSLKRLGLELGGKTPMLVFNDANLDAAMPTIEKALTVFAGQFCMTGSRILVQSAIAQKVREQLGARLRRVKAGPASDPTSDMGPMIDKPNVERVNGMVEDAIRAGAKVIVRGGPITEGPLARGAFYRPTLLEVSNPKLPIFQAEVFGPVLVMIVFETEAEAIALANDSEYGLSAGIWTRDVDRPWRVARELQSGTIWINDWVLMTEGFEEGGFKNSGVGRLRGFAGLDDFMEYKHIAFKPGMVGPQKRPEIET